MSVLRIGASSLSVLSLFTPFSFLFNYLASWSTWLRTAWLYTPAQFPSTLHGNHTSLYRSCPPILVKKVERFIWLRKVGEFAQAHQLLKTELSRYQHHPLVLIEAAELYNAQTRYGMMWRILGDGIESLRGSKVKLDLPEWRLISLIHAMAAVLHRGTLEPAVEQLQRTRLWLQELDVDKYTDIQVDCTRNYLLNYHMIACASNLNEVEAPTIPKSKSKAGPWQGLQDLRQSLLAQGRFRELVPLFRVELRRLPPSHRLKAISSLADQLQQLPWEPDIILCQMELNFECAKPQISDNISIRKLFLEAYYDKLREWCDLVGFESIKTHPGALSARYLDLEMQDEGEAKYIAALSYFEFLKSRGHWRAADCLEIARSLAKTLSEQKQHEGSEIEAESYRESYRIHSQTLLDYDMKVNESVWDVVSHHHERLGATNHIEHNRSCLEWIDSFFASHPDFSIPTLMMSLLRSKATLQQNLGDWAGVEKTAEMFGKIVQLQPDYKRISGILMFEDDEPVESDINLTDILVADWAACSGLDDSASDVFGFSILQALRFAKDDMMNGFWSPTEVHICLNCPCGTPDDLNTHYAYLGSLESKDTFKLVSELFVASEEDWDKDITENMYASRRMHFANWLRGPGKGLPSQRHFHLWAIMLRSVMAASKDTNGITANERSLALLQETSELTKALHPVLLKLFRSQPIFIESRLSFCYLWRFENQLLSPKEAYDNLAASERHALQALGQLEAHNDQDSQQTVLGILARICLARAGLASDETEGFLGSVPVLCQKGLQYIERSERIASHNARGFTSGTGLKAIVEMNQASQKRFSWIKNAWNAIELLRADTSLSDAERSEKMWGWVQIHKARTMNRILSKGLESTQALKKTVEEWDREIDEAPPLAKMHLKIEKELRIRRSKTLETLRATGEGAALNREELKEIVRVAETPVVLVDWMIWTSKTAKTQERIALMFTVRIDGENEPVFHFDPVREPEDLDDYSKWAGEAYKGGENIDMPLSTRYFRDDFAAEFSGLIEPLAERSRPGDLVVLCPTRTLHLMPLHALELEHDGSWTPLIRRNPVVYTYSHSLLRSTMQSFFNGLKSGSNSSMIFYNGIHEHSARGESYQVGRDSITELASRHGTKAFVNDTATKENLVQGMDQSRLVHIHTHCDYTKSALEHCLILPKMSPDRKDPTPSVQHDYLPAAEIFDKRFLPGTHFNLIACGGGITDFTLGDDVLGIVPAFLTAGASSTIATLWPIEDAEGAKFSEIFWRKWDEQMVARGSIVAAEGTKVKAAGMFNAAKALQETMLEMDQYGDEPLSVWAAYVLHGFWMIGMD